MRVLIAYTGTGGHLIAGLSIAKAFKKKRKQVQVFFLGSDYRHSYRLIHSEGFELNRIYAVGFADRTIWGLIQFLFGQVISIVQSGLLIMLIRPEIVIGTGGFASVGSVLWAKLFGIPVLIHEQNVIPGKANRMLGCLADKILLSFDGAMKYFNGSKCSITGMPVRFGIPSRKIGIRKALITILVMGGSSGAHRINQVMMDSVNRLIEYRDLVRFIHLSGVKDYKFVKDTYRRLGFNADVEPFSFGMEHIYSVSSLVIGRSGSGSISEITFFGLPAVLIPYPYSRDKHQLKNAQVLSKAGAGIIIEESELSSEKLRHILVELLNNPERLSDMSQKSLALSMPDASKKITDEIEYFIQRK